MVMPLAGMTQREAQDLQRRAQVTGRQLLALLWREHRWGPEYHLISQQLIQKREVFRLDYAMPAAQRFGLIRHGRTQVHPGRAVKVTLPSRPARVIGLRPSRGPSRLAPWDSLTTCPPPSRRLRAGILPRSPRKPKFPALARSTPLRSG